jgi:hypothetical protein
MGAHESHQVRPKPCPVGDAVVVQGKVLAVVGDHDAPHLGKGFKGGHPTAQGIGLVRGQVIRQEELVESPRVLFYPALVII